MEKPSGGERVRCSLRGVGWVGAAFLVLVGLFFGAMPFVLSGQNFLAGSVFVTAAACAGPFLLPGILWAAVQMRAEVVADEEGLHWRGLGRTQSATWDNVTDYYDKVQTVSHGSQVRAWLVIETRRGKVRLCLDGRTRVPEMRAFVAQRATAAKARTWGVRRERPEDWPLVFHYDTRGNRNAPTVLVRWHGITLTAVLVYGVWLWVTTHTLPGWGLLLTPTGLFLIVKEMVLLALHPLYVETRRRLGQRITLRAQGLLFEDGDRQIVADWDEITDFYVRGFAGNRFVIESTRGDFDFLGTLKDSDFLQRAVLRSALRAGRATWRSRASISLSREDGANARAYTYRSPAVQEAIGTPAAFSGVLVFLIGLTVWMTLASGTSFSPLERYALALAIILVLLWVWIGWRCTKAYIVTDASGITQATILGLRFLPWAEVREFHWSGNADLTFGNVVGPYGRIRFWRKIEDADRLAAEIAARSVNCRQKLVGVRTTHGASVQAGE